MPVHNIATHTCAHTLLLHTHAHTHYCYTHMRAHIIATHTCPLAPSLTFMPLWPKRKRAFHFHRLFAAARDRSRGHSFRRSYSPHFRRSQRPHFHSQPETTVFMITLWPRRKRAFHFTASSPQLETALKATVFRRSYSPHFHRSHRPHFHSQPETAVSSQPETAFRRSQRLDFHRR
jgi:hypothetical protein